MGIYIKGYKIPNGECEHLILDFENMTAFAAFGDRKHYKLVEVTEPHGPLIDESQIKTVYGEAMVTRHQGYTSRTEKITHTDAPTVIEAEGE